VIAVVSVTGGIVTGSGHADPAADALAKLTELSRQAEQTTEEMHTAQVDLDKKLGVQKVAEDKHTADLAAADGAKSELASYQQVVDKLAAAMYMGGRTDGLSAILTASSPQNLIDQMTAQDSIANEMAAQMASYRSLSQKTTAAEAASSKSEAEARTAAAQAAAVRADVQAKQSKLQVQIAIVKSQYLALTPTQRAALAGPGVPPPATLPDAPEALPDDLPPPPEVNINAMPGPDGLIPPGDMAEPHGESGPEGTIVVQAALSRIGSPYSWGASGPNAFDCSGLVMWAFQQAGVALPHSSQALAHGGQPVDLSQMQPGDVVTYYGDASHAAIYIGDGMMVHASTYGTPVRVAPVGNAPIYNVRRY
jgi:cell wall-associated NlpC family hydrolase